jgi:anti-anti-sigma regulatory factor
MATINVAIVVQTGDLLDPTDGTALAVLTAQSLSAERLLLDFGGVTAISSAFANAFFVELASATKLGELRSVLDFINLRPRWAQVWAQSLKAVRARLDPASSAAALPE